MSLSALDKINLESLTSLSQCMSNGLPLSLAAIDLDAEGVPVLRAPPGDASHVFEHEGMTVKVAILPDNEQGATGTCQIWAEIGRAPETADTAHQRRQLLAILRAARKQDGVRFAVEGKRRILAMAESRMENGITPETVMLAIINFWQRMRPWAGLMRRRMHGGTVSAA